MPLKYFNCPDGKTRLIIECLATCPRPEGRCLRLPYLYGISRIRPWIGKASTTQLLNPTRMEYLKIIYDYAVVPKSRAFALLGTRHHYKLEQAGKKLEGIEVEKYLDGDTTGIVDLLEPDELKEGWYVLTDYKTWGSFSVSLFLGLGDKDGKYERQQASLQLNNYRVKVEALGFPVSRMFIQCTVRDGHTRSAYANKIEDTILVLPVERLDDDFVKDYFSKKSKALLTALEKNELPEMCPFEERWNGRRCKGSLCEVHRFCPEGAKINKVELEK